MGLYWRTAAILMALAGAKDTETQETEALTIALLTSLKPISWQLAEAKLCHVQPPGPRPPRSNFPKCLRNVNSASPLPGRARLSPQELSAADLLHGATALGEVQSHPNDLCLSSLTFPQRH